MNKFRLAGQMKGALLYTIRCSALRYLPLPKGKTGLPAIECINIRNGAYRNDMLR